MRPIDPVKSLNVLDKIHLFNFNNGQLLCIIVFNGFCEEANCHNLGQPNSTSCDIIISKKKQKKTKQNGLITLQ